MNGIYIEITNACNLTCSFCPSKSVTSRRFMNFELFKRSLDEALTVVPHVYFHILGEPTLHPQFAIFLNYLNSTPAKLTLTTNGTTISKWELVLLASKAIRQINFSTHAYAEMPIHLAKEHLKHVLDFAKNANTMRKELYINFRLWNMGVCEINPWNNLVLEEINKTFFCNLTQKNFCSRHKSFVIKDSIYLHEDSRFEWPTFGKNENNTGTCRALETHAGILSNGDVVACCLDYQGYTKLGNILEAPLSVILNSALACRMRQGFKEHKLLHPLCKNCEFCKRFK